MVNENAEALHGLRFRMAPAVSSGVEGEDADMGIGGPVRGTGAVVQNAGRDILTLDSPGVEEEEERASGELTEAEVAWMQEQGGAHGRGQEGGDEGSIWGGIADEEERAGMRRGQLRQPSPHRQRSQSFQPAQPRQHPRPVAQQHRGYEQYEQEGTGDEYDEVEQVARGAQFNPMIKGFKGGEDRFSESFHLYARTRLPVAPEASWTRLPDAPGGEEWRRVAREGGGPWTRLPDAPRGTTRTLAEHASDGEAENGRDQGRS